MPLRSPCLALCLGLVLGAAGAAAAPEERFAIEEMPGPVPVRILSPIDIRFFQLAPERAVTLEPGTWTGRMELTESNVLHELREGFEFASEVDLELTRFQLGFAYGLAEGWELGMEVPVLMTHDGFLDPLIKGIEEAVGKLKPRRREEDQHEFAYRLSWNGEPFFEGRRGSGLGDLAVTAKRALAPQRGWRPALALRGALKLPTGDRDAGFGNGVAEAGLGVAAEWDRFPWFVFAGAQVTSPLGPIDAGPELSSQPLASAYVDAAYAATPWLSLHLQLAARTAPFGVPPQLRPSDAREQSRETLTGDVVQVSPAVGWRIAPGKTLYLGLSEDFMSSEDAASDVTLFATFSYNPGR